MKILYVEDTLLNLCLVERIARMGNHAMINYASAEQALRNFEQDKPDLVLIDLRLEGEMSGVELIQRLRSAGHQQPIVVITAIVTDDMRERCRLVGANAYFTKPIAVRDLLHIIQRHEKILADATKETPPDQPIERSKEASKETAGATNKPGKPVQSPPETRLKTENPPSDQPDQAAATKQTGS
jgi:CheY-like chemotaxis protein